MILINIGKLVLNFIYLFMKLFKVKKRVLLISRLSDTTPLNLYLISEEIKKYDSTYEVVILSNRLNKNFKGYIKYAFITLKQAYFLATSKLVIVDSYIPAVSLLQHKKKTVVIQIWHAIGAFKKFGYSIIDKPEGSSLALAKTMHMHENYDYVICSGKESIKCFSEAFNVNSDKIIVSILPHIEFYKENRKKIKTSIYKKYPELKNKKNIIYAPTFRKNKKNYFKDLIKNVDYDKYNLIIKKHSGVHLIYIEGKLKYRFTTRNLGILCVADNVITDYSAVTYDALLLNIPVSFYIPDYNEYKEDRGFYFDYESFIPGKTSDNINEVLKLVDKRNKIKEQILIDKFIDLKSQNIYAIIIERGNL